LFVVNSHLKIWNVKVTIEKVLNIFRLGIFVKISLKQALV